MAKERTPAEEVVWQQGQEATNSISVDYVAELEQLLLSLVNGAQYIDALEAEYIIEVVDSFTDSATKQLSPEDPTVIKFKKLARDISNNRSLINQRFINRQLVAQEKFFSSIETHGLDQQQATAVLTDEFNTLVIAGAGSGKTTTIVGKIKYLVEHQHIPPSAILPISFTNKSVASLQQRVNIPGIEAKTFHSLGFVIVKQVEQRDIDVFGQNNYLLNKRISEITAKLLANPSHASDFTNFFVNYLKPPKSEFDFASHGAYIQYLKDNNFSTYKMVKPEYGTKTLRHEQVNSVEECIIANFLLFNNVEYEYERQYAHTKDPYKPDFTITHQGQVIYLEHFGIDRNGNVPKFFAKDGQTYAEARQKYLEGIDWKRQLHQQHQTVLIESYSYELSEGILIDQLKLKLEQVGITLHPKSPQEIAKIIQQSARQELDQFTKLITTFTTLFKLSGKSIKELRQSNFANRQDPIKFHRLESFLNIYEPIFNEYQQALLEHNQIDFSDMLSKAITYIEEGRFIIPWRYLIIDEFQDVSIGIYRLLAAIRQQKPGIKFFCVGDDWQSIYRFNGSDVGLFTEFEKYFGPTAHVHIQTTHRFGNPLLDISSNFITKNPHQIKKQLKSSTATTTLSLFQVPVNGTPTDTLSQTLHYLEQSGMNPKSSVLVLGRYNNDFDSLDYTTANMQLKSTPENSRRIMYTFQEQPHQGQTIDIKCLTVHSAKGLEADFVIVLNCNSGLMGFPCLRNDDPILSLLLSVADQFESSEERRLFYVALTRAKKAVYLIADYNYPSIFIQELLGEKLDQQVDMCPWCKQGRLELKEGMKDGKRWAFYGCSNRSYGCDYKDWIT